MKWPLLTLITILLALPVFAQQIQKADDALLLEYYQSQRFAEAADYLKKSYPEPVTDTKVLAKLAYTSQMAGKLVDAEGYYQRIYDNDSTNTAVLFNLGSINLRRGNNLKAEGYYKKITQKDTTNFVVYKQLAKISFDKSDMLGAITFLQKANKINPAEPDVASDLSDLYVNFKQYPLAEKALSQAITADPENVTLLLSLLKLNYAEAKFVELKNTCLELNKLGDHSAFVLTKLGAAYYNLKDYECCVATLADIPETEKSETSYYMAALAYKELKDQPAAIENLMKAIETGISPNIASYYAEVADSHEKLLKYKKAAQAYIKGLQFTETPIVYYLLANLYDTKLKDKKNAIKYYKKFLASHPTEKQQVYIAYAKSRVELLKK